VPFADVAPEDGLAANHDELVLADDLGGGRDDMMEIFLAHP
jgi:hypothetical protein